MKIHNSTRDTFYSTSSIQMIINRLNELARRGNYVFRGYGKQDELLPSIIRGKTSYANVESDLLKDFEKYGSS